MAHVVSSTNATIPLGKVMILKNGAGKKNVQVAEVNEIPYVFETIYEPLHVATRGFTMQKILKMIHKTLKSITFTVGKRTNVKKEEKRIFEVFSLHVDDLSVLYTFVIQIADTCGHAVEDGAVPKSVQ